jgi:hypothetical protein
MTKASEYITSVLEQLGAEEQGPQSLNRALHRGAFLAAALSIIGEIESPLKERALVSLASLAVRHHSDTSVVNRKAA